MRFRGFVERCQEPRSLLVCLVEPTIDEVAALISMQTPRCKELVYVGLRGVVPLELYHVLIAVLH